MKRLLLWLACLIGLAAAPVAFATPPPPITVPIANFNGSFGSGSAVVNGPFSFKYTFMLPLKSITSASVTAATVKPPNPGITFSHVTLNGVTLGNQIVGGIQLWAIDGLVVPPGMQTLWVEGEGPGSFGFSVAAAPAPVPETATWAMMLGGFGLAGMALRSRRALVTA